MEKRKNHLQEFGAKAACMKSIMEAMKFWGHRKEKVATNDSFIVGLTQKNQLNILIILVLTSFVL